MTTLSNIFTREKTLFYFSMWNDSDRMGYEDFLGYKVQHNLFLIPPVGQKGSVWYSNDELQKIDELLDEKVKDQSFERQIVEILDLYWPKITQYLEGSDEIQTPDELLLYYRDLVTWWSAMNTVFSVPDKESASIEFKNKILSYREKSEKYTEKMNKVFVWYWNKSKYPELATVLTPYEAAKILKEGMTEDESTVFHARLNGCAMFDEEVFLLSEIDSELQKAGVEMEKVQINDVKEIKGRPAYVGIVRGPVKIIRVFADASKIVQGDILVTEMTNPDYVPFMKLAGAIVTDEGGTTCHAAIASRELKVPCIVGTRIATKILKDGDMVEVDAEKGIVKIVK